MRFPLIICSCAGLLACILSSVPAQAAVNDDASQFYARAKQQARLLPLQPLADRKIIIDGKLDDWGDMRQDSFAIHQLLDHTVPDFNQSWKAQWENEPMDAALIKLVYNNEALYVAIQVADDSVISTAAPNRLGGDVVDMYLDVRPFTGAEPALGHCKYTEGVYQLVFSPPNGNDPLYVLQPDSDTYTDWRPGQKVARLGAYDAKGSLFNGGYTVELRLPLTSIPFKVTPDRFAQPIGFEVMVADQDAQRTKGRPDRLYYSCSGYSGNKEYFKSPSMFACTDPGLRTALPLSRLRNNALKHTSGGDECEGWFITDVNEKDLAAAYLAAAKSVASYAEPTAKPAWSNESFTTYPCPALGLAFHHRRVLSRLPAVCPSCVGNRYAAVLPADGRQLKIDGMLNEWGDLAQGGAQLFEFGNLPSCTGIPGRTDMATVKLMTDQDTLYIAIVVKDDAVVNPGGLDKRFAGDGVQIFLDIRPPNDGLSSDGYGDGVYQFSIAPPTIDKQSAAFIQGAQKVRRAGPIAFASSFLIDGYTVEMAIPLASLMDNPVPGRFNQPFGFEALVTDIDKPDANGQYAPLLTYCWGGADEKALQSAPSRFSCTDNAANRLPEIRALVDDTPVTITADFTHTLQPVSGFGGNLYNDQYPFPHTVDGRDGKYALSSFNSLYVAENTHPAWIRANVGLYQWGALAKDWKKLTTEPITLHEDITARKLIGMRLPIEHMIGLAGRPDTSDNYYMIVMDWYLAMLKPWAHRNTQIILYADDFPAGMTSKTAGDGNPTIAREMWPAYAECVSSFMLYARKVFGIEFTHFAIKDVPRGNLYFSEREYCDLLKYLGAYFEKQGLKTKLMLCDTGSFYDFRWYCNTGMSTDKELLQYVGAIGVELSGSVEVSLPTYRLWSDMARSIDKPLVITSFGRPYVSSTTYLFDEIRIWQQITRELLPQAAIVKQFVAEKSYQWIMVYGQNIVQDKERNLPVLSLSSIAGTEKDVLPTLRYWSTRQFCDLTPTGQAIQIDSDHPQVLVTGFTGKLDARDVQTLHISNAGPARKAVVTGLPATLRSLHVVRSGGGEGFHNAGDVAVKNGKVEIDLPAWSLVSLTAMPVGVN